MRYPLAPCTRQAKDERHESILDERTKKIRTFDTVKPGLFGIDCGLFKLPDDDRWVFDSGWLMII